MDNVSSAVRLHRFHPAEKDKETRLQKKGPHARNEAKEQERTRWIVCLTELHKGTDTPMGKELSERPQIIQLLGTGKRAVSLRLRVCGVQKFRAWLTVAHVILKNRFTMAAMCTLMYKELLSSPLPCTGPRQVPLIFSSMSVSLPCFRLFPLQIISSQKTTGEDRDRAFGLVVNDSCCFSLHFEWLPTDWKLLNLHADTTRDYLVLMPQLRDWIRPPAAGIQCSAIRGTTLL